MKVLSREWFNTTRSDEWRLFPLGDIHLGNEACHEDRFCQTVKQIADDDRALWIGLGDYADFIQRTDPRFDPLSLPRWAIGKADICGAQAERFLEIVEPIASKCLGLIEGNHERAILKRFERDIYAQIVTGVKDAGGFEPEHHLAWGIEGWLHLKFYRSAERKHARILKVKLHHGFVGGKLAGAKALNMQRMLWNHNCHLCIMGHSHNSAVQVEAVEETVGSSVVYRNRIGMYGGTYLQGARYAQLKGYFPIPLTQPHVVLRPGANEERDRIRVVSTI